MSAAPHLPLPDPEPVDAGGNAPFKLVDPSFRGVVRLIAIVVFCAIALYLLWRLRAVVRLEAIALFVALALNPVVDALDNRAPIKRAPIILGLYAALLAVVVVIGVLVVPSMVKQVQQLSHDAPHYAQELRRNPTFRRYDDRYRITPKLQQEAHQLPSTLAKQTGSLQQVTVKAFGVVGQLVTVLSIAFLLMLRGRDYVNIALRLAGHNEARYRSLVVQINRAVAGYMLGNLAISALATLASWIVLSLLGVPYAVSLAIVVGFFDLIPMVGATLGAIIAGLATATVGFPETTIIWIGFVIVYQWFENYLVQPLVYGRTLSVNPLVTIVAVLAGGSLLGILGALLAIPIAAAIQILLSDWWANRRAPAAATS
jgi:predicted PurR-regulated permease PerM